MKVLSVTSEIYPLIKTGGLADVAGALPLALSAYGVETRSLIPGYPAVMKAVGDKAEKLVTLYDLFGEQADVLPPAMTVWTFSFSMRRHFSIASAIPITPPWRGLFRQLAPVRCAVQGSGRNRRWRTSGLEPDLVHAHDWQAAMTPVYMRFAKTPEKPSVLTIHNIAFQGNFSTDIFPWLGLPEHALAVDGVEYFGNISFLKGGLQTTWAVTTVSPTYAREIQTPQYGMGLEGLISARAPHRYRHRQRHRHRCLGSGNGCKPCQPLFRPQTESPVAQQTGAERAFRPRQ